MAKNGRPGMGRAERKAQGLCYDCFPARPATQGVRCDDCAARNREAAKRANNRSRGRGKCELCGSYSGRERLCSHHRSASTPLEVLRRIEQLEESLLSRVDEEIKRIAAVGEEMRKLRELIKRAA